MTEVYREQSSLPRDSLRAMGQVRSKSIVTDTIRQVNAIYTTSHLSDSDDNDLNIQAGALSVAGTVRFKGGFIEDSIGLSVASDAFAVGFFPQSLSLGGYEDVAAATAVRIPAVNGNLSVGYVLKAATEDGHLMWAPDTADDVFDLYVRNDALVGNDLVVSRDLSVGGILTGDHVDMKSGIFDELSVGRLTIGADAIVFDDVVDFPSISVGTLYVDSVAEVESLIARDGVEGASAQFESISVGGLVFNEASSDGILSVADLFFDTTHGVHAAFRELSVTQSVKFTEASGDSIDVGTLSVTQSDTGNARVSELSVGTVSVVDGAFSSVTTNSLRGQNGRLTNMLVENNLTVNGNVTSVSTEQIVIEDHRLELAAVSSYLPVTTFLVQQTLVDRDTSIFLRTQHGVLAGSNDGSTRVAADYFVQIDSATGAMYLKRILLLSRDEIADGLLSVGGGLSTGEAFTGQAYELSIGGLVQPGDLNQLDWITALRARTANVNGEYGPQFALPGQAVPGDAYVWCTNLFRPSQDSSDYKFASATHSVQIESFTQVLRVGTTSGGGELYDSSVSNNGYYVYELQLTTPAAINVVDIEDGIEVNISQFHDANAIGGGIVIKGDSDKSIEYVRTSMHTPANRVGAWPSAECPYAPQQLSGFLASEDIVLNTKRHAHENVSVGGHFLDVSPRSNALHMGDMRTHHWIICASWPSSIACGLHADEDDAPKLQFWFGSDVYDDSSMETQEMSGTRLGFEITAPVTTPLNAPSSAYAGYNHPSPYAFH